MAIYDCFMLNDEQEIVTWRINYLINAVDYFVIAESATTFSGKPKPFYLDQVLEKLEIEPERIIRVKYEFPQEMLKNRAETGNNWPLEMYARNSLIQTIETLKADDFVLLSDVDEIPSVAQIAEGVQTEELKSLQTPLLYGKLNWYSPDGFKWNTVKIGHAKYFCQQDLNLLKHKRVRIIRDFPGGHYSDQFITTDDLIKKAQNSAHSEFQLDNNLHERMLRFSEKYRINHFGRFSRKGLGIIRVRQIQDLNEFQVGILDYAPEHFDFTPCEKSLPLRMVASFIVARFWKIGHFDELAEWQMYLISPFVFVLHFQARAIDNFKRVLRRISILRH
jgi:hypothetical protein